jgi:DNA polymerase-1
LAEKTGIPEPQAEEFIKGYYKGFAGITAWKQQVIADGYRTGYVSTMSGRRRRLPDLKSNDRLPRMRAERQAVNAVVQGSAADLCKLAMIDCFNVFEHSPAQMLVQVHDEIVVAVPAEDVDEMKDMLVTAMGHGKIYDGIPLKVSCHAAPSWAEGKGAK